MEASQYTREPVCNGDGLVVYTTEHRSLLSPQFVVWLAPVSTWSALEHQEDRARRRVDGWGVPVVSRSAPALFLARWQTMLALGAGGVAVWMFIGANPEGEFSSIYTSDAQVRSLNEVQT